MPFCGRSSDNSARKSWSGPSREYEVVTNWPDRPRRLRLVRFTGQSSGDQLRPRLSQSGDRDPCPLHDLWKSVRGEIDDMMRGRPWLTWPTPHPGQAAGGCGRAGQAPLLFAPDPGAISAPVWSSGRYDPRPEIDELDPTISMSRSQRIFGNGSPIRLVSSLKRPDRP